MAHQHPHHTDIHPSDAASSRSDDDASSPHDDDASALAATPRSRVRIGVGAAVIVALAALVCAVLVSLLTPQGRVDTIALAAAGGAHGSASGASATPVPGNSGGAAPASGGSGASGSSAGSGAAGASESGGATAATPGSAASKARAAASSGGTTTSTVSSGAAGSPAAGGIVLVHVLGAVAKPGLYQLAAGDRVLDAVTAAGGFAPNADQGQQNLARVVKDGEQLVVPELGAAPPLGSAAASAGSAPGAGAVSAAGAAVTGAPVNLNTADEPTLETLPHVGPAMAARIIAWRSANGSFTQVDDLKNVSGIGDKTFAELEPLVTV